MRRFEIPTNKVKVLLGTWEFLSGLVDVSVDSSSESGKLCQQVEGILVGVSPVVGLLDALLVRGGEGTVVVQGSDTHPKLGHGVQSVGKATKKNRIPRLLLTDGPQNDSRVNEFLDEFGEFSALRELVGEGTDLFWGRNLSGEQEPEHALRENLLAIRGCGKLLLAIWNGQSVEADALKIYGEF